MRNSSHFARVERVESEAVLRVRRGRHLAKKVPSPEPPTGLDAFLIAESGAVGAQGTIQKSARTEPFRGFTETVRGVGLRRRPSRPLDGHVQLRAFQRR